MSEPQHRLLVSIDFGTYGFFVAYAHPSNCRDARGVEEWSRSDVQYGKILNAILISKSNPDNVLAYGFEARDKYVEAQENKEDEDMAYFKNFKLQLLQRDEEDFNANKEILAEDGFKRDLCPLVAQCLGKIKEHTLKFYRNREGPIEERDILWILSVPVAWTEQSQEAMKQCCYHIGIPEENVLIVSEPEAAGSYLIWATEEGQALREGDKYLCVDVGSGTYDIVCHELITDRKLEEIDHPVGDLFGAVNVDNAFKQLLRDIFGDQAMNEFEGSWPTSSVQQLKYFQDVRERVRVDDASRKVQIVDLLVEIAEDEFDVDVEEKCAQYRVNGSDEPCVTYKLRSGVHRLELTSVLWKHLFSEVVENICDAVRDKLDRPECDGVKQVFAVGGFSKSDFIQDGLQRLLSDDFSDEEITLVCPIRPELATARGSLWYADKCAISSRRMKVAYGLATERASRRGDPLDLRRPDPNYFGYKTINCFETLWDKGARYEVGEFHDKEFPLIPGQKDVVIEIIRSTEELTKFIRDDTCSRAHRWHYEISPEEVSARPQTLAAKFKFGQDCLWLEVRVKKDDGTYGSFQRQHMEFDVNWGDNREDSAERPVAEDGGDA